MFSEAFYITLIIAGAIMAIALMAYGFAGLMDTRERKVKKRVRETENEYLLQLLWSIWRKARATDQHGMFLYTTEEIAESVNHYTLPVDEFKKLDSFLRNRTAKYTTGRLTMITEKLD